MSQVTYNEEFYKQHEDGSLQSAHQILPILLKMMPCKCVVDVGCGDGNWLRAFKDLGIIDVLGIDGDYVDTNLLKIPEHQFIRHDLSKPLEIARQFDLVVSVEVAEHIPAECADVFVNSLTRLGSTILFSAAIPHQGGTYHVNEQWPTYWIEKFDKRGYQVLDCIRPRIWNNPKVEWWYAQNILLFVRQDAIQDNSLLREAIIPSYASLSLVHPHRFVQLSKAFNYIANPENKSVRRAIQELNLSIKCALKRRLKRLQGFKNPDEST